jgi:hypothetical protein
METIIDRIVGAAGHHAGAGDGTESGPFAATLDITPILGGLGAAIDYLATAPDGSELHREHTVLAFDMWSGEATLFVLCEELNGMGQLVQVGASTFANGRGTEGFEVQIDLVVDDDHLEYAWSWGQPGEPLAEQTRASFSRR